jgi:hypothetical protein
MALAPNLLIFREVSEQVSGRCLLLRLYEALSKIRVDEADSVLSALIVAGELECALADSVSEALPGAALITDALAHEILESASLDLEHIFALLGDIEHSMPDLVRTSHPEGFSYYALHPADFADAAARSVEVGSVGVIGIRSIGTTLSAMARSALTRRGVSASRITVRPVGHPYDRETALTDSQTAWLEQHKQKGSTFLIVDEGPGLSGSSFVSVAEALEHRGISAARITLLGTRDADPAHLCTHDATHRWLRYGWQKAGSTIAEAYSDHLSLSGGSWRRTLLTSRAEWPACWPEMESLKFLAPDYRTVFKFDGLGRPGERNRWRAAALFEAGFAPKPTHSKAGMASYGFVRGFSLAPSDLSIEVLDRIADYCAFRAHSFQAEPQSAQLPEMLRFNLLQEMRVELDVPSGYFQPEIAVIPDCRMQTHEWIRSSKGTLVKVDGNAAGEGHFLPGPTDILWDIAGAIVEWNMSADAEEYLLAQFQKRAGRIDEVRLQWFMLAYTVFRLSYCRMAYSATQDIAEKRRLHQAALYYKRLVDSALQRSSINGLGRFASRTSVPVC